MVLPPDYIPGFVCSLETCSVKLWGYVKYQPSLPGNVLFLVLIDLLALAQLILGPMHRTGLVCITMLLGLAAESTGYVSRVLLHFDPFSRIYFLMYLINLTIGPAFIAAAIYLTLGRIVVVYGEEISRIKPRTYTIFFMGCDFISLSIQAVGGGIAASYPLDNQKMIDLGTHILVAGLAFQVASLFAFLVCAGEFLWRVKKYSHLRNPEFADLVNTRRFKLFIGSILLATITLFVRTVFRSVELSEGFSGKLANDEVQFMVLDGVMVIIATICMTAMHPGYAFRKRWSDSSFAFWGPEASMTYAERSRRIADRRTEHDNKAVRLAQAQTEFAERRAARRREMTTGARYVSNNEKTAPVVSEAVAHRT
ncbi:hypothetical protein VTL71DRAFT_2872 [Oculimacula yallundae]|uniref:Uncharacterized protein n=1 Tax=Oculimacula yallundae TaxID=86028 RepID=A0ABR4C5J3_9HELO